MKKYSVIIEYFDCVVEADSKEEAIEKALILYKDSAECKIEIEEINE